MNSRLFGAMVVMVVVGCENPGEVGEGFWLADINGTVRTSGGEPIEGAEVQAFSWDSLIVDWRFPDDIDTTDAAGTYSLTVGTFGGSRRRCIDSWAHVQVTAGIDTARVSAVPVDLCISERPEYAVDLCIACD